MLRWLPRVGLSLVLLVLLAAFGAWCLMRGSLPLLAGDRALVGLAAPATVSRDAHGVVTIDAANEGDALRALGFVHAQERFFEMDLTRRSPAGELSALFGTRALPVDRRNRMHRMRARVEGSLATIAGERMPLLRAYADGANAGLAALPVRPWPYLLLRQQPRPWTPADSALAGFAMYFDLQDADNARELALWLMRPHLPPALYALLTRDGSRWDAPLLGASRGDAALPDAAVVDLRRLPAPASASAAAVASDLAPGSNSFAVAASATADGRAIVANDMHLGLRAPNIWFRVRLRYADPRAPAGRVDVSGFSLPGVPAVIVGSNTHVAWGFTNSYGDFLDWSRVRPCRAGTTRGCDPVARHVEHIAVSGGPGETLVVEETPWGPILHALPDGSGLALRWTAHQPRALNFGLADFAWAPDLDAALVIADRTATPTQNLVVADRRGAIAWRLLGPIANRMAGCDARVLVANDAPAARTRTGTARCAPWTIDTATSPLVRSPQAARLWTANNRLVDGAMLEHIGDGGTALGARARQIRAGLGARARLEERDLLAIQLDDRAVLLDDWWRLLQELGAVPATRAEPVPPGAAPQASSPALQELARATRTWEGRASIGSVSYRVVRAWRLAVHARLLDGLTAPAQAALGTAFAMPELPQFEGVAWPLVQARPAHLLPRRFGCAPMPAAGGCGWDALFEEAAREVRDELAGI
ncbi:MAG TPA: penicillin acylase family protein, partial [Luteimonas sp.]|nr:penicillin acylase family protein [Luteimonas sp.]